MSKRISNYSQSQQLIKEMKQMLRPKTTIYSLMNEGLVYGEDGEEYLGDEPEMGGGEMPQGKPQQMPNQGMTNPEVGNQQMSPTVKKENNPLDGDQEITQLITNIRVQTLQGMTKLAENPESAQYELLKKIFLLVDKAVEDKVNPEKELN